MTEQSATVHIHGDPRTAVLRSGVRPSPREQDRAALSGVLQAISVEAGSSAAEQLDVILKRLAARIDRSDTDEGAERVQTALVTAVQDAIVYVARREGRQDVAALARENPSARAGRFTE